MSGKNLSTKKWVYLELSAFFQVETNFQQKQTVDIKRLFIVQIHPISLLDINDLKKSFPEDFEVREYVYRKDLPKNVFFRREGAGSANLKDEIIQYLGQKGWEAYAVISIEPEKTSGIDGRYPHYFFKKET